MHYVPAIIRQHFSNCFLHNYSFFYSLIIPLYRCCTLSGAYPMYLILLINIEVSTFYVW